MGGILHDQIRLADLPRRPIRKVDRGRHIRRIAQRGATIDPASNQIDFCIGQRRVVLELLDPDRLVDVPGRHLASHDPVLDRPGPRADLLVGDQRHRSHLARAMTDLTGALQDGDDVFRKRHLIVGSRAPLRRHRHDHRKRREQHPRKRSRANGSVTAHPQHLQFPLRARLRPREDEGKRAPSWQGPPTQQSMLPASAGLILHGESHRPGWRIGEVQMRVHIVAIVRVFAVVIAVASLAPVSVDAQPSSSSDAASLPRMPDGRPDLHGVWDFASVTPLRRPAAMAGKEFLTDEDVSALEAQAAGRVDRPPPRATRRLQPVLVCLRHEGRRHQANIADRRPSGRATASLPGRRTGAHGSPRGGATAERGSGGP